MNGELSEKHRDAMSHPFCFYRMPYIHRSFPAKESHNWWPIEFWGSSIESGHPMIFRHSVHAVRVLSSDRYGAVKDNFDD